MNYKKIYSALIRNGINRQFGKSKKDLRSEIGYIEKHHILPTCMGGTNDKSNLVFLTAQEHFVAHLLLVKIYPEENRLIVACQAMTMCGGNNERKSGRLYKFLREKYALVVSKRMKDIPKTEAHKENLSKALVGRSAPRMVGSGNPMHQPGIKEKALASRKGKLRAQKRDSLVFKFQNVETSELFEGTRQQFRDYAKITPVDVYALISGSQKTSKKWRIADNTKD